MHIISEKQEKWSYWFQVHKKLGILNPPTKRTCLHCNLYRILSWLQIIYTYTKHLSLHMNALKTPQLYIFSKTTISYAFAHALGNRHSRSQRFNAVCTKENMLIRANFIKNKFRVFYSLYFMYTRYLENPLKNAPRLTETNVHAIGYCS